LNQRGTIEHPGPASDKRVMEGSEAEAASEGLHPADRPRSSTSDVTQEEQILHNTADAAEKCSRAEDEAEPAGEFIDATTDLPTDAKMKSGPQTCSRENEEGSELDADDGSDGSAVPVDGGIPSLSDEAGGAFAAPITTLDHVVESSPVVEGTTATTLTVDEVKECHATTPDGNEQPSVSIRNGSSEQSPADDSGSAESPSSLSLQSASKNSSTDSTTTSGFWNGPSTPSSDTVGSSLASSPRTGADTSAPSHLLLSPYDTDCSRKLMSQIQRSLSQDSLLDELESELLASQLPQGESGGEGKGSPPINGLPTDEEDCMVAFEKCVQYKYTQQEKSIHR